MTIDKNSKVTVPVWMLSALVSLLIAGFTAYGISTASTAKLEERTARSAADIQLLDKEKVDKEVFQGVLKRLDDIFVNQSIMQQKLDKMENDK